MPRGRTLTKIVALAAVAGLTVSATAARSQYRTLTTAEDFDKLLAELTVEAEGYAESAGDAPPRVSNAVSDIEYDPRAAEHLIRAIQKPHKQQLVRLHVAYQLMQPLDNAGEQQLQQLRPALMGLSDICRYKPMPTWPQYDLAKLTGPDENVPDEARKRREDARAKFLAKKLAAEKAVVKFNRLADALQKQLKVLLVRMADEQADKLLLASLAEEEHSRWDTFGTTLDAIAAEAVRMTQGQAKRYYDALRQHMRRSDQKRQYLDPTRPTYSHTENSSFANRQMWFAQEAARVVNLLATSAKEPAVIVPGQKRPPVRRPVRPRQRPR